MKFIYNEASSQRIDLFVNKEANISRSQVSNLIKKKLIKLNNKIINKGGILLKENDIVELGQISKDSILISKSDISIQRIYEDSDILVINKPPYLAVHGAPSLKEENLTDWLKANNIRLSNISGELREGIVHRLDKQTSGAMVIAKNNTSHAFLSSQLINREMGRIYIALIDLPLKNDVAIECNLARNPKNRLKFSKTNSMSKYTKYSKSDFSKLLLSKDSKKELILARLSTGRTHQIRAHLESINRHILGDILYGYKGEDLRIMLHSYILYLEHPKNGKMSFCANIFDDMKIYLQNNFIMEKVNEIMDNLHTRFNN